MQQVRSKFVASAESILEHEHFALEMSKNHALAPFSVPSACFVIQTSVSPWRALHFASEQPPYVRKISILVLPRAMLKMFNVAIANVLVLIPPPVDCGEAPIHISNITNMIVEKLSCEKSKVLNPAVLGVVAPKSAVTIFPKPSCSVKVLFNSKK